jgi:hypothetical protein
MTTTLANLISNNHGLHTFYDACQRVADIVMLLRQSMVGVLC